MREITDAETRYDEIYRAALNAASLSSPSGREKAVRGWLETIRAEHDYEATALEAASKERDAAFVALWEAVQRLCDAELEPNATDHMRRELYAAEDAVMAAVEAARPHIEAIREGL